MAYVITDSCIKDELCVEVCPTDCIHPKKDEPQFEAATRCRRSRRLHRLRRLRPRLPSDAIFVAEELPEDKKEFLEKNAAYYKK